MDSIELRDSAARLSFIPSKQTMRVLLTSHGSTGDIFPVIGLGRALLEAGHEVRFASARFFREEIERAGLEYVYLPPDWDQAEFAKAMRDLTKAKNPLELVRMIYAESLPYLRAILETLDEELARADLFVSSYLFGNLCGLARLRGVPCAVTNFAHNAVPAFSHPPQGVPPILFLPPFLQRKWNALAWGIADRIFCRLIHGVVGAEAERYGIERIKSFFLDPADKVVVTVSPTLFQPKQLWNEHFVFAGYLRWQSPEDAALEEQLKDFCAGERVPVLTFGSMNFDAADAVMARFMRNWPKGKKIIIQSGWAELRIESAREEMLRVGKVSHDQLFKHASLVIHHGGAGTTASVLHAGVPHVVIPHIGDQRFFAQEMKRLGVGLGLKRSKWPEELPKAVRTIEGNDPFRQEAEAVAEILRREDGPGTAVRELEALVKAGASGRHV
jgi:vancomycin aglycone glucosyltransferase